MKFAIITLLNTRLRAQT